MYVFNAWTSYMFQQRYEDTRGAEWHPQPREQYWKAPVELSAVFHTLTNKKKIIAYYYFPYLPNDKFYKLFQRT